jgi:type IV secretory pathway VirB3-like protein
MAKAYTLQIDTLALGLTRPAMVAGIPLKLAFSLVMAAALAYIYLQTLWVLPVFALLYFIALRLTAKEPRFFELQLKHFLMTPWVLNYPYWGGTNSYCPW